MNEKLIMSAEQIEVEENICLHVTAAGEGRNVVLLHGWPLSDEQYKYQYEELIKNGFRVLSICFRGYGKSDKPMGEYNYDVHARDVEKVLTHFDVRDAVLCGFSMGGAIAVRYAANDKDSRISKLVLEAAAAPIWTQREDYPYNLKVSEVDELIKLNNTNREQLLTDFGKIFTSSETSLSPNINNWLYEIGLSASPYAMEQCLIALRDTDLREDLKKIKIPTLILQGRNDKICSYKMGEEILKGITESEMVIFEHSGHALFLEETEKFNYELIKFAKPDVKAPIEIMDDETMNKTLLEENIL
jgi:pimeloyl-ACP methyl ester carboxylesterase